MADHFKIISDPYLLISSPCGLSWDPSCPDHHLLITATSISFPPNLWRERQKHSLWREGGLEVIA